MEYQESSAEAHPPPMCHSLLPLVDYALEANGGGIYPSLTTLEGSPNPQIPVVGSSAVEVINDSCQVSHRWCFSLHSGQVGLRLATPIYPSNITLDHIPRLYSINPQNAPRSVIVWGVIDGSENEARFSRLKRGPHRGEAWHGSQDRPKQSIHQDFVAIAEFQFDMYADWHIQTFPVKEFVGVYGFDFGLVVVEVLTNWGGSETCLHRVRVHGRPVTNTL